MDLNKRCFQEIRLVDGQGSRNESIFSGRVEVRQPNGTWGTVCAWSGFDSNDASVICKMFDFEFGVPRSSYYFGEGVGDIYMDFLRCTGDERSVFTCPYFGWGSHFSWCDHSNDAGVICSKTPVSTLIIVILY